MSEVMNVGVMNVGQSLTLMAATEDQADFITGEGTAGGQELLQEEEV